jgi:hypothetical protein
MQQFHIDHDLLCQLGAQPSTCRMCPVSTTPCQNPLDYLGTHFGMNLMPVKLSPETWVTQHMYQIHV